jgi:hypothetical protein
MSLVSTEGVGLSIINGGVLKDVTIVGLETKSGSVTVTSGINTTITGTLTINGASATRRMVVWSTQIGISGTITAANTVMTFCDFRDITAAGAGAPFSGFGDLLGNTNVTFPASVDRYAVAAGNWTSTTIWSDQSGGAPGASFPLPQDNVFLDTASGTGTISIDIQRIAANIDTTGFSGTLHNGAITEIYGSVKVSPTMIFNALSTWSFGGRGAHTITSAGQAFADVTIAAPGGVYSMTDDLTSTAAFTNSSGTFNTNDFRLVMTKFTTPNDGAVTNFGSSTVDMTLTSGTVFSRTGAAVITAGGAVFNIIAPSASSRTFVIGTTNNSLANSTINYIVEGSTGALTLTLGSIGTLNFYDALNARTLILPANSTTTITKKFYVHGYPGKLVSLQSATGGAAFTLSKDSGVVACDFLSIRDSTATGGAQWYAGRNSVDTSNNTGWIFSAAPGRGGFLPFLQP